jgi:thioredoxin reductase
MSSASILRGKTLLASLSNKLANQGEEEEVITGTICEARAAFSLATLLCPENEDTIQENKKLQCLISELFGEKWLNHEQAFHERKKASIQNRSTEESLSEQNTDIEIDTCEQKAVHNEENLGGSVALEPKLDVIIVGAGASGIGVAATLIGNFGISRDRILLLERGSQVGTSFKLWPKEMRFISPSFNQQGWTSSFDLNSIANGTSPATFTQEEHPTGEQYARYLQTAADDFALPIQFGTDVTSIRPLGKPGHPLFEVHVAKSPQVQGSPREDRTVLQCRFVIWAAGEFQYPKRSGAIPGAELCCHNTTVRSWATHAGDDFVVIGGYESGIDAAVNLATSNRPVVVVASSPCWEESSRDPSGELAPYTRARLKQVMASEYSEKLTLHSGLRVTKVTHEGDRYHVHAGGTKAAPQSNTKHTDSKEQTIPPESESVEAISSRIFVTSSPPILCIGFEGSVMSLVKNLFDWEQQGQVSSDPESEQVPAAGESLTHPRLTDEDESTRTEGLFLVGPQVSHEGLIFCFVYKFRQRFAVVASAIASRLGKDTHMGVLTCRSADMFLDDFVGVHACCG